MSMILGIKAVEFRDLVISLIALIIAFSVLFAGRQLDTDMILITTLGVASGFLLHELAHKFTAMHFGYLAEYRANLAGLGLAVVSAFAGFIIAAPGAVMISRSRPPAQAYIQDSMDGSAVPDPFQQQEELARQLKREMLLISLAGPLTNIVLAETFFILGSSGLWPEAVGFAIFINLILAAFNMLPLGPLDGKKVFDADRRVWALVVLLGILIVLQIYF